MKRDTALSIAGITRHQYYYKPKSGRRGKPPSQETLRINGEDVECVPNHVVIEQIRTTQADPDTDYGYHKMTYVLLILGYLINHKKVYRLMNENDLLKDRSQKFSPILTLHRRMAILRASTLSFLKDLGGRLSDTLSSSIGKYEPERSSPLTCDNPRWVGAGVCIERNERRRIISTTIGLIITFGRSLL